MGVNNNYMSRNSIIWTVVVIIVIALGIWYFAYDGGSGMMSGTATSTNATSTMATSTDTTGTQSTTGTGNGTTVASGTATFHSIFTQNGNYECDFSQTSASAQGRNVIYIADGKMRGEFRTSSGNVTTATLMIYSGGYLYSWQEGATTGTKTAISSLSQLPTAVPENLRSGAVLGTSDSSVGWDSTTGRRTRASSPSRRT